MPYDTVIDGVQLTNIPDGVAPNDPRLKQRAQALKGQQALSQRLDTARFAKEDWKSSTQRAREAAGEALGPDLTLTDKLMLNLGAGAADVMPALHQMTGLGEQPSPEEIAEKRRIDDALAGQGLPGFGWKQAQEMGRNPATALPTRTVLANIAQGAVGGAMEPTLPEESRFINTAGGGVAGGAMPFVAGTLARSVGSLLPGVAKREARSEIDKALEAATPEGRARAMGRQPPGPPPAPPGAAPGPNDAPGLPFDLNFPYTPAALAGNAEMARLEKGSRARNPAEYYPGDVERHTALRDAVLRGTREAEELATRKAAANQGWKQDWQQVEQTIDPVDFKTSGDLFRQHLEDLKLHGEAEDSDVMEALNFISNRYDKHAAAGTLTPTHVQVWRRILNEGGDKLNQNALKRADPSAVPIAQLRGDLDAWLNQSSGGNWQTVLDNYTAASRAIDQAKAAGKVRSKWWELGEDTNVPVRTRGTTVDTKREVPEFTEHGLSTAQDLAMGSDKVSGLSPDAKTALKQTMDVLARQGLATKVAKSGTLGGSDTAMNFMSMLDQGLLNAIPGLASITPYLGDMIKSRKANLGGLQKTIVDKALADPAEFQRLMSSPVLRPEIKQAIQAAVYGESRLAGGEAALESSRKDQQP
jgi:hypothetical protein